MSFAEAFASAGLNQNLPGAGNQLIDLLHHRVISRDFRPPSLRARHPRCCAEQSADERPLLVGLASIRTKVDTVPLGQGRVMFGLALGWQPGQLYRRRSDRPAAVVAARLTLKAGDSPTQLINPAAQTIHCRVLVGARIIHTQPRAPFDQGSHNQAPMGAITGRLISRWSNARITSFERSANLRRNGLPAHSATVCDPWSNKRSIESYSALLGG